MHAPSPSLRPLSAPRSLEATTPTRTPELPPALRLQKAEVMREEAAAPEACKQESPTSTAECSPSCSSTASTETVPSVTSVSYPECVSRTPTRPPPMPEVTSLPIGHENSLAIGDDVVLLGYGQAGRGVGPPSATNTRGVFSGSFEHPITGSWLRTDALMLSGHSGGPLLNRRGEVVGWSVRSGFDRVLNGDGLYASGLNEVRPASALLPHVRDVLGGQIPSVAGMITPGQHTLGGAEAREAAMAALAHAFAAVGGCAGRGDDTSSECSSATSSGAGASARAGGAAEADVPRIDLSRLRGSGSSNGSASSSNDSRPVLDLISWLRRSSAHASAEVPLSRESSPPNSSHGKSDGEVSPGSVEAGQPNRQHMYPSMNTPCHPSVYRV